MKNFEIRCIHSKKYVLVYPNGEKEFFTSKKDALNSLKLVTFKQYEIMNISQQYF